MTAHSASTAVKNCQTNVHSHTTDALEQTKSEGIRKKDKLSISHSNSHRKQGKANAVVSTYIYIILQTDKSARQHSKPSHITARNKLLSQFLLRRKKRQADSNKDDGRVGDANANL